LLCEKAEWPVQPVFDLMCCVTPEDHGISLSCPKIFSDWKENTKRAEHYGKQKKKKNTCRLLIERSRRTNVCHALREKVSSGVKKKKNKKERKKLNFYMFRAAPSIIGFFQSFFRTGDFPRLYGGPSDFHLFGL
jgi:4-diphosphocytidyl-2C-methyl-D-erythritol kinase